MTDSIPTMGDTVRVAVTPETTASGHAGLVGQCLGFTTPSATGVEVIGPPGHDFAVVVSFPDVGLGDAWFDPSVVTILDHTPGMEITIGERRFVRSAEGEWLPA